MQDGFYWTKWDDSEDWEVAEASDGVWYRTGSDYVYGRGNDPFTFEIGARVTQ